MEATRGNFLTANCVCKNNWKFSRENWGTCAFVFICFCLVTFFFFSPNSALTEKIVSVLPKMKCPHRLEPHQIQGLDFIHIFPVVQVIIVLCINTLLKKAIKFAFRL